MREIKFRCKRLGFDKWLYFDMSNYLTDDSGLPPDFLEYPLDVETVGQFILINDVNGKNIFFNDIIDVCVFFVSPQNTDNDIHFRGVVIEHELKVCLKIYSFLYDSSGWKKLSDTTRHFPFDTDYIEDDHTFIIPLHDLCAMSGNLGEILEENLEVIGNIHENKELLNEKTA